VPEQSARRLDRALRVRHAHVAAQAEREADLLAQEPGAERPPPELAIRAQVSHARLPERRDESPDQALPLREARVPRLPQHLKEQREGYPRVDEGEDQHVEVNLPQLPVRAVQHQNERGQHPAHQDHQVPGESGWGEGREVRGEARKEPLQPSVVATRLGVAGERVRQVRQAHGSAGDNGDEEPGQQGNTGRRCPAAPALQ
jgi:hypothetical protein